METNLENIITLVPSSTRGIGLSCATRLAECGAKVYLAVRNMQSGGEAVRQLRGRGLKAEAVYFDATVPETIGTMMTETLDREGRLDILVNNFGHTDTAADLDLLGGDAEAFFHIVDVNLRSVYLTCRAAVKSMLKTGGGSIVNISSVGGKVPDVSRTAYGVAKAAINFLTRDIAVQYARYGIRCNAVLPGFIATDAAQGNMSQEFADAFVACVPAGRMGRAEDIASAVAFLASDGASYITGQLLSAAGGFDDVSPMYALYARMNRKG